MRHTNRNYDNQEILYLLFLLEKSFKQQKKRPLIVLLVRQKDIVAGLISLCVITVEKRNDMATYSSLRKWLCNLKQYVGNHVLM